MLNKNIFNSLLSTITTIGSLSIIGSCGYDAYKEAQNKANADVFELNLQRQFNTPINANMLLNNPYQTMSNLNQPSNLQTLGVKIKGWFQGAVNSLSSNFIPLSTAALGALCGSNYLGKMFFIGSLVSFWGKNLLKTNKNSNNQMGNMLLNKNQMPYMQASSLPLTPIMPSTSLVNPVIMPPSLPIYGTQIISPATPYIPNNSPYIPYQQQMRVF